MTAVAAVAAVSACAAGARVTDAASRTACASFTGASCCRASCCRASCRSAAFTGASSCCRAARAALQRASAASVTLTAAHVAVASDVTAADARAAPAAARVDQPCTAEIRARASCAVSTAAVARCEQTIAIHCAASAAETKRQETAEHLRAKLLERTSKHAPSFCFPRSISSAICAPRAIRTKINTRLCMQLL
jgi:hypothetical protein